MTFSMANNGITWLNGTSYKLNNITWTGSSSLYFSSGLGLVYFGSQGTTFPSLYVPQSNNIQLTSDLKVTGRLTIDAGNGAGVTSAMRANGFNVTVDVLNLIANSGTGVYPAVDMGSGQWTFTGSGVVANLYAGTNGSTATVVFPDTGPTSKTVNFYASRDVSLGVVKNSANPNTVVTLYSPDAFGLGSVGTLVLAPGSVTQIDSRGGTSYPNRISDLQVDGSGNPATLQSLGASTAYIVRPTTSGAAPVITLNYVQLKNLSFSGYATWRALKAANLGNVSGITFVKDSGNFVPFF